MEFSSLCFAHRKFRAIAQFVWYGHHSIYFRVVFWVIKIRFTTEKYFYSFILFEQFFNFFFTSFYFYFRLHENGKKSRKWDSDSSYFFSSFCILIYLLNYILWDNFFYHFLLFAFNVLFLLDYRFLFCGLAVYFSINWTCSFFCFLNIERAAFFPVSFFFESEHTNGSVHQI